MVQINQKRLAEVCRDNGIARLRIFGSMVRGEEGEGSDVDLIADFASPVGFFELIRAEDGLAMFFNRPVDLLTEGAISPFIKERVLREAETIFDAGS